MKLPCAVSTWSIIFNTFPELFLIVYVHYSFNLIEIFQKTDQCFSIMVNENKKGKTNEKKLLKIIGQISESKNYNCYANLIFAQKDIFLLGQRVTCKAKKGFVAFFGFTW